MSRSFSSTRTDCCPNTFDYILRPMDRILTCQGWEDFLDFSRMSFTKKRWKIRNRLKTNLFHRFVGNYIRMWITALIICWFLVDRRQRFHNQYNHGQGCGIAVGSLVLMLLWICWSVYMSSNNNGKLRQARLTVVGKRVSN